MTAAHAEPPRRRAWGRPARLLLPPAAALALAACALPAPPDAAPPAVPAAWHAPLPDAGPAPSAPGWEVLGDAALLPLLREAWAGATDVEAAQARLRQARAQLDATTAATMPTLDASAGAQLSAAEARPTGRSIQLGLDAGWLPDPWGGARARTRAAEAGVLAGEAGLAAARLAVAGEVALDLVAWRGTQARLAIAGDNLANQQRTLQLTRWRHEAGLASGLDVLQAQASVAQTAAQLPALQAQSAQLLHALAVLTGRAPGTLAEPAAAAAAAPFGLDVAIPAEVLRRRPDVQAAEARVHAAAAGIVQAQADRLPALRLGGSIGLSATRLAALGSGAGAASLAASVSLPVLDAGRGRALVQAQQAGWDEARAVYRATVLGALREVEDQLVAIARSRTQVDRLREAAGAAREAAHVAEQRYAAGLADFPNLLLSQRTLLSAQDALAGASTALATQQVRLLLALGGGESPGTPPPAPPGPPR